MSTPLTSTPDPAVRALAVVAGDAVRRVPGALRLAPGLALVMPDAASVPPSRPRRGHDLVVGVHGCGVVRGRFVTDADGMQPLLEEVGDSDALGSAIRGVMTAYVWRGADRVLDVLPDPWGGLVHVHRSPDLTVVSSDLGAVVSVLTALGRRPAKSLEFCTEVASMGSGGLSPSSYEGIEVLDVLCWLRVGAGGVTTHRYRVADEVMTPFASYDEGLDAIRAEIEGNVQAATAAGGVDGSALIAHLTGGIDTRLILAATTKLGLTGHYRYLSIGPRTTRDREVGEQLAVEQGLLMTEDQGFTLTRTPSTLGEEALWRMTHAHGMLTSGPHEHQVGSDTIVLSGGYGGYLKGNYSGTPGASELGRSREDSATLTELLWGAKAFSRDPAVGLFAPNLIEARIDRFHALRQEAFDWGLSDAAALDWLFIRVRNRYFLAEATRGWNAYVHRFDPLYCLSGARLALSLPAHERSANRVVFDLMRGWAPDLLGLPFDHPRVSAEYEALSGPIVRREFTHPGRRPALDDRPGPHVSDGGRPDAEETTPEVVERARALQAPLWQVRDLERARGALRGMMTTVGPERRAAVFNQQPLDGLLYAELRHRGLIRQVHSLHASLLWYSATPPAEGSAPDGPAPAAAVGMGARIRGALRRVRDELGPG